jgi:putative inorganic carbon (HCO3(-)) transporter
MGNKERYKSLIKDNIMVIGASALTIFFVIISVLFIRNGATILWFIPVGMIMALLALISIEKFLLLTVFLVPLSVQLRFILPDTSADIFLPTEPMLAAILIIVLFKIFVSRELSKKVLFHPVSVISFILLAWYLFTSLTSTMPLVSLKSFTARLWFFAGFFILAAEVFRKPERIRSYFLAFISGMVPVISYFLIRMWQAGILNQKAAYRSVFPFFNDHTSFGAALAFSIPVLIFLLAKKGSSKGGRIILFIMFLLFSAAFVLCYSRAAWLSLGCAGLISIILLLRISWKIIVPSIVILFAAVAMLWSGIIMKLDENRKESSADIKSHIESIANITTDASNLERINRWNSALRMFAEKPLMGWGPATYQFCYAPFQVASEKTIISTNWGEGGNAHSEYLGALVDSGLPGMIIYILLLVISVWKGITIFKRSHDMQTKFLALALVAGLVTYVVHGALNNFLDTDKISALFWGMIAAVVAIDIRGDQETVKGNSSQVGSNN